MSLSTCSTLFPVFFARMSTNARFCCATSFHLMCTSMACLWPVEGTRGWCSIAVACLVMYRFPLFPALRIMAAWPYATPVPTVKISLPMYFMVS